jgi:hypothetical protein
MNHADEAQIESVRLIDQRIEPESGIHQQHFGGVEIADPVFVGTKLIDRIDPFVSAMNGGIKIEPAGDFREVSIVGQPDNRRNNQLITQYPRGSEQKGTPGVQHYGPVYRFIRHRALLPTKIVSSMTKRSATVCVVILVGLFLVANRAAYKGYFQDDELDNLSWAPRAEPLTFLTGILTPRFAPNNFRPVGHFYFHEGGRLFGLDFPKYVAVLQLFHLFNVWLLWLVARQLRAPPAAAYFACLFFALHMALFDAFWKPMYVFDVLCGAFCLLAILFWTQRRWVLSFASFWLAYKAKELAVMLPVVLACYEFWMGKRQWKPLLPFFAASFSFGLQGLLLNPNKDNDYTFRFTFAALRKTSTFYAGRIFLVPYLGFLAPAAAFLSRNRRTWFGLAMAGILAFPLFFLPGRIFSAYCYVPFAGLALALSGVAETAGPVPVALFLLLFVPLDLRELRTHRGATLALDNDVRAWVTGLRDFARTSPPLDGLVWSGEIPGFATWGVEGAARYVFHQPDLNVASADDAAGRDLLRHGRVAYIAWNPGARRPIVMLHAQDTPDLPYIDFNQSTPVWQLEQGWFNLEAGYRWTEPVATAHLLRPPGARRFTLRALVGPDRFRGAGPVTLRVFLNDQPLEPRTLPTPGWHDLVWDIPGGDPGPVQMKLQADPPFRPSMEGRTLGIAVGAFGFER